MNEVWIFSFYLGYRPKTRSCQFYQTDSVMNYYYMASSARGQDELNREMWLTTWAVKIELSCPLRTTRCIPQEKFPRKPYNKSFIDQVWGQDGWIFASIFFGEFMDLDFVSVHKHAKKNLANTQPSWPHTWSITHIYYFLPGFGSL